MDSKQAKDMAIKGASNFKDGVISSIGTSSRTFSKYLTKIADKADELQHKGSARSADIPKFTDGKVLTDGKERTDKN